MKSISDLIRNIIAGYDPVPTVEKFTKPEQLENLNTAVKLFEKTPQSKLKDEFKKHFKGDLGEEFFELAKKLYNKATTPSSAQGQWDMLKLKNTKYKGAPKKEEWSPFLVANFLRRLSGIVY